MTKNSWNYATRNAFLGASDFHEMTQQMRTIMKHSDKKLGSKLIHNFARYVFIDGLRRGNPNISEEALQKEWYDFAASFDDKPKFILDIKHSGEPLGKIDLRTELGFTQADIERVVAQAETNLQEPEGCTCKFGAECDYNPCRAIVAEVEFDPKSHPCRGEECSCSFGHPDAITEKVLIGDGNARLARSLAEMLIEWVDGGIKGGTDWRNGLESVILSRIQRLANSEAYFKGLDAVENNHVFDWVILEFYPVTTQALFKSPFSGTEAQAKSVFKETCYCASIPDRSSIHVLVQNHGPENGGWKIALIEGIIETYQLVDKLVDRITHWVQTEALVPTPKTEAGDRMYAFVQYSVPSTIAKFTAAFPATVEEVEKMFAEDCRSRKRAVGDVMLALTLNYDGKWIVYRREPSSSQRLTDWSYDTPEFRSLIDDWASFGCTVNSFAVGERP